MPKSHGTLTNQEKFNRFKRSFNKYSTHFQLAEILHQNYPKLSVNHLCCLMTSVCGKLIALFISQIGKPEELYRRYSVCRKMLSREININIPSLKNYPYKEIQLYLTFDTKIILAYLKKISPDCRDILTEFGEVDESKYSSMIQDIITERTNTILSYINNTFLREMVDIASVDNNSDQKQGSTKMLKRKNDIHEVDPHIKFKKRLKYTIFDSKIPDSFKIEENKNISSSP